MLLQTLNEKSPIGWLKGKIGQIHEVKQMKIENWITNTTAVRAWMSNELKDDGVRATLSGIFDMANEQSSEDFLSSMWTAVRNIAGHLDGFPKARVGQPSVLSQEGQANVANVASLVRGAFASIGENHDILLKVILPHGRTGGEFESWSAYCDHMASTAENNMLSAVKENRWNAEEDILTCQAPLTKAEKDALKEEGGVTQEE